STHSLPPSLHTLSLHDALPILALMSGEIHFLFDGPTTAIAARQGGKAKMLAVVDANRYAVVPDVPTIAEAGYEGLYIAGGMQFLDRKSTRLNSSHVKISYAVFC